MNSAVTLFRFTLVRTLAALFFFELLVGFLAYTLLMSPVLDKLAQNFAQQIVQNSSIHTESFTRVKTQPEDGGRSWLPFNYFLAKHLEQLTGNAVQVHHVAASGSWYWLKIANKHYVVYDHQVVDGAQPIKTLVAWLGLALAVPLLISGVLAIGISQPIMQLRKNLHTQSTQPGNARSLGITELDTLRLDFFNLTEKLALARDDRTTLLLGLSHELSAPVARLTMALALYAHGLPEEQRAAMQADIDALRRIIEQFLSAAKCLGEQPQAQGALSGLMHWLAQHYSDQPQVILHADTLGSGLAFNVMAAERILINLIDNGLRHTQGSQVHVDAQVANELLVLTVSDVGPGLSETEIKQVFQPFNRRHSSQGLGLGLALVRLLADQNGWEMALTNRLPHGIVASIKIPIS